MIISTEISEISSKLKEVAGMEMTAEQIRQQKISFVMGTVGDDSDVTQEDVEKIIAKQEGK